MSDSTNEDSPQGEWDRIAEQMVLTFAESTHPVFQFTSPLSRGVLKSKGGGKLSIHYCANPGTIETVFRTIIYVNQLRIYGAVSDMCEECDTCHHRTGRPVVEGQSNPLFVPSVMKTHIPLNDLFFEKTWRNAKPFYRNAEPQRRAAQHLGHTCKIGKRFCKSNSVFFSTLSARVESMEFSCIRTNSLFTGGEEWKPNTSSRSEMPVRTVSQKFNHPQ